MALYREGFLIHEGRDMVYLFIGGGLFAVLYCAVWARNVRQTRRGLR